MSEDKTKISDNEEPTEGLPKTPTTNMMLETLLLKVNEGFAKIDLRFEQIDSRFDKVDSRLDKVDSRLDKIEARLDTVEKDIKEIKRNQRVFNNQLLAIEGRLTDLEDERKAS
jgi:septal ring factor EnvC (AmiA/AmiB activator)